MRPLAVLARRTSKLVRGCLFLFPPAISLSTGRKYSATDWISRLLSVLGCSPSQYAAEACRRALQAARLIAWHLAEMNRTLASELQQPIAYGVGIHAGEVIIGTMGYRQHAQMTAIGEAVHIASRLQELTKEYQCQLVVSEIVGTTAGVSLDDFPAIKSDCAD